MRKLALVAACVLATLPGVALASTLGPDAPHWDCPNGLHVNIGGSASNQQIVREWVDYYNAKRAEQAVPGNTGRSAWPFIRSIAYAPEDGIVTSRGTCAIDFDERAEGLTGRGGYAQVEYRKPSGHLLGCGVMVNSSYNEGGGFVDYFKVYHEMGHCLGLGHEMDDPASVMSYEYQSLDFGAADLNTLSRELYPQYGGGH